MNIPRQSTIAIGALLLSVLPLHRATAQDYPTKPVRIISGFGAGSAGDVLVRLDADIKRWKEVITAAGLRR